MTHLVFLTLQDQVLFISVVLLRLWPVYYYLVPDLGNTQKAGSKLFQALTSRLQPLVPLYFGSVGLDLTVVQS